MKTLLLLVTILYLTGAIPKFKNFNKRTISKHRVTRGADNGPNQIKFADFLKLPVEINKGGKESEKAQLKDLMKWTTLPDNTTFVVHGSSRSMIEYVTSYYNATVPAFKKQKFNTVFIDWSYFILPEINPLSAEVNIIRAVILGEFFAVIIQRLFPTKGLNFVVDDIGSIVAARAARQLKIDSLPVNFIFSTNERNLNCVDCSELYLNHTLAKYVQGMHDTHKFPNRSHRDFYFAKKGKRSDRKKKIYEFFSEDVASGGTKYKAMRCKNYEEFVQNKCDGYLSSFYNIKKIPESPEKYFYDF